MSMRLRRTISVATASLLCLYAMHAAAANLVTNPDFDGNLNGWTMGNIDGGNGALATFALDASDGSPAAPSAEFTTSLNQSSAATSNCIVIDTSQNVDLFANAKIVSGNAISTSAGVFIYMFGNTSCEGQRIGPQIVNAANGSLGAWQQISSTNFPLLAGTQSVRIVLEAQGGVPVEPGVGDVLFDHIVFQQTGGTSVTLQSFEVK